MTENELVTCPMCDGTGSINLPDPPPDPPPSRIEENLNYLFSSMKLGNATNRPVEEKKPYKTCSKCRGFGFVRKFTPPS
jgi:excinuclease UvrABC ATPase subunit